MGGCRAFRGSALLFVLLELSLVCCDITDGNAEHLKREHSLTKPYQGRGVSPGANPQTRGRLRGFSGPAEAPSRLHVHSSYTECLRAFKDRVAECPPAGLKGPKHSLVGSWKIDSSWQENTPNMTHLYQEATQRLLSDRLQSAWTSFFASLRLEICASEENQSYIFV